MELVPGIRSVSRMFVKEPQDVKERSTEVHKSRSKSIASQYSSVFSLHEKPSISPLNFEQFLPWACRSLWVEATVHVIKLLQDDYIAVSSHRLKRVRLKRSIQNLRDIASVQSSIVNFNEMAEGVIVTLLAYYNTRDRLVAIQINRCGTVTQRFLKVLSIAVTYHPLLRQFKMIRGHLNKYVLYEMSKFLSSSLITEVFLDDTYTAEGNYYVLLDNECRINRLSLKRCRITDKVLELIAERLVKNEGPAKGLYVLELASNFITDSGALMIAKVLRSNRKLLHLNLAGNQITDVGAEHILNTLKEFVLTTSEVKETVGKHMEFYKNKQKVYEKVLAEQKRRAAAAQADPTLPLLPATISVAPPSANKPSRQKAGEPIPRTRRASRVSMVPITKIPPTPEEIAALITNQMTGGKLRHEFDNDNTERRGGQVYCKGNFRLCSLNLAYNHLQMYNVETIAEILEYQKLREDRSEMFPGLLRVVIEGNYLPQSSDLYETVEDLLFRALCSRMPLRVVESMRETRRHNRTTKF